nr:MAG TPA: hypothetical protein [Caudoviricetes sp.]
MHYIFPIWKFFQFIFDCHSFCRLPSKGNPTYYSQSNSNPK